MERPLLAPSPDHSPPDGYGQQEPQPAEMYPCCSALHGLRRSNHDCALYSHACTCIRVQAPPPSLKLPLASRLGGNPPRVVAPLPAPPPNSLTPCPLPTWTRYRVMTTWGLRMVPEGVVPTSPHPLRVSRRPPSLWTVLPDLSE